MTTLAINKYYVEHTKYDNSYYIPGIINLYFRTTDSLLAPKGQMSKLFIPFLIKEGEFSGFMELLHINIETSIMLNDVISLHFENNKIMLEIDLEDVGKLSIPLDLQSSKKLLHKLQLLYNDFLVKKVQKLY